MAKYSHRLLKKDNIDTEIILPSKYDVGAEDPSGLTGYLFQGIEEGFADRVNEGDFLVAGENFGCGAPREMPAAVLKASGISAVIASGFSRTFYRNALNMGLCLVECETNYIDDMDELELDLDKCLLKNLSKGVNLEITPIPHIMKCYLDKGGIVEYFKEYGTLDVVEK